MGNKITHTGIIVATKPRSVTVRIGADHEQCGACALASLCTKPQTLEVACPSPTPDLIGRKATLEFSNGSQRRAVVLFLAIPIILLLVSALICSLLGCSEGLLAALALGSVAAWFIILYICKGWINQKEVVALVKID